MNDQPTTDDQREAVGWSPIESGPGHASFCGNAEPHYQHRHPLPDSYDVCSGVEWPARPSAPTITTGRDSRVWRTLQDHAREGSVDLGGWRCRCGVIGSDGYHGHARHQADEVAALGDRGAAVTDQLRAKPTPPPPTMPTGPAASSTGQGPQPIVINAVHSTQRDAEVALLSAALATQQQLTLDAQAELHRLQQTPSMQCLLDAFLQSRMVLEPERPANNDLPFDPSSGPYAWRITINPKENPL